MNGRWIFIWIALFIIAETVAHIMGASQSWFWGIFIISYIILCFAAIFGMNNDD